jgi:hypothetical protein
VAAPRPDAPPVTTAATDESSFIIFSLQNCSSPSGERI